MAYPSLLAVHGLLNGIVKRLLDLVMGTFLFLLFSPLFLLLALLIKRDSPGPIFFIQGRIGMQGQVFLMYKFRTMVLNAEKMGTGLFSYSDDPRVTRVGRILRIMSLDEMPQIFNVILGTMSLVGPRPPVTYELGPYEGLSDQWKIRFKVKPGITGLAQVSGRNDLTWDQKIEFDNRYVELYQRWGIVVDLIILLRTVFVVLSMSNVIEKKPENDSK